MIAKELFKHIEICRKKYYHHILTYKFQYCRPWRELTTKTSFTSAHILHVLTKMTKEWFTRVKEAQMQPLPFMQAQAQGKNSFILQLASRLFAV